jgi:hypothetical protein
MEHCQPKRPGDTTGAGRVWTDQGLVRNGGDQPFSNRFEMPLVVGGEVGRLSGFLAFANQMGQPGSGRFRPVFLAQPTLPTNPVIRRSCRRSLICLPACVVNSRVHRLPAQR